MGHRQPLWFVPLKEIGRRGRKTSEEATASLSAQPEKSLNDGRQGQWRKGITSRSPVNYPGEPGGKPTKPFPGRAGSESGNCGLL